MATIYASVTFNVPWNCLIMRIITCPVKLICSLSNDTMPPATSLFFLPHQVKMITYICTVRATYLLVPYQWSLDLISYPN
jgi:hypothetical protein